MENDIQITGKISWMDYKRVLRSSTTDEEKLDIIEKYVRVPNDGEGVDADKVIAAFKEAVTGNTNPN